MTEIKTENTTEDDDSFLNYTDQLPSDLNTKDIDYLRQRIDSGLPTDNPKSKRIKSAIQNFIENTKVSHNIEGLMKLALFILIMFTILAITSPNSLAINNFLFPYTWALIATVFAILDYENTRAGISVIGKNYKHTLFTKTKRYTIRAMVFIIPFTMLFVTYKDNPEYSAGVKELTTGLLIVVAAYGISTARKRLIKRTFKKYNIGKYKIGE